MRSACITVSTESAMTSRETREKCMPSWPMEMPSETEMVPNCMGKPPPAWTPSLAPWASRFRDRLQGVISFHELATPICGLAKSSSPMPTARNMPRAGRRGSVGDDPAAGLDVRLVVGCCLGVLHSWLKVYGSAADANDPERRVKRKTGNISIK